MRAYILEIKTGSVRDAPMIENTDSSTFHAAKIFRSFNPFGIDLPRRNRDVGLRRDDSVRRKQTIQS